MVSALLPLRRYQEQAIEAVDEWLNAEPANRRCAVVLPTGGGKTVVFSHMAKRTDGRVLVLVHTDELVRQAVKKIQDVAPHLHVGVVKAKENEVTADVIVASVATLRNPRRLEQVRDIKLIIVDECHHAVARSYMTILEHFGAFRPDGVPVVGFTATLVRGDDKSLGAVWQHVPFSRDISWMVRKQYLIPPVGRAVKVPDLNLAAVTVTKKDYREGELGEALAESLAPELVAKAYAEHSKDRRGILFAPTVASAEVFAEAFEAEGIKAEVIHGALPQDQRDTILDRHRAGVTQVVANCMVLTEGYDDPVVNCIVVARPTRSKGLYVQMVGRGLRVDPARPYGEQDCLILDVVGAGVTHDLRSVVDLSEKPLFKEKAEGRKLTDLEDEFDAGQGVAEEPPNYWTGPVEVKEFDPLGAAKRSKVWIRTAGGTYFVPAGTGAYVFIMEWPRPGRWSVAWCSKDGQTSLHACEVPSVICSCGTPGRLPLHGRKQVAMTEHRDMDLETAMAWAEDLAVDMGVDTLNLANKKASWRKAPPSTKMQNLARGLGEPWDGKENAGKLSDRIDKVTGSRRIDPLVNRVKGKMQ